MDGIECLQGSIQHVQGSIQCGGATASVVVGDGPMAAFPERQPGPGAVQRQDLGLLTE